MTTSITQRWIRNNKLFIAITNEGIHDIEDIPKLFRGEPSVTRQACSPLLRVVAERCHELDGDTAQAFYDLFYLCV